jgi:hypothetical protein
MVAYLEWLYNVFVVYVKVLGRTINMASLNLCTLEAVKYKQITLAWNNFNSAE